MPQVTAGSLFRLRKDDRGLALLEFALTLPLVLAMGGYGIEISNLALVNLRISQYALDLADNASRVGLSSGLTVTQLRESDISDVLAATKLEGTPLNLTTYGRVTLSSLENVQQSYDTTPVQRIHWQRCIGLKSGTGYDSSFGITSPLATAGSDSTSANKGTTAATGMGNPAVSVPAGYGLMYVEINYDYQSLFGSLFVGPRKIQYAASFIVRDKRDYTHIYGYTAAAAQTCDKHTA